MPEAPRCDWGFRCDRGLDDPSGVPANHHSDRGGIVSEMFQRIAGDLSMLSDSTIEVSGVTVEDRTDRPATARGVHISFRFGMVGPGGVEHGALLLPIAESISLGAHLMMAGPAQIEELQREGLVEGPIREAILEVGSFVTGALQAGIPGSGQSGWKFVFEGCQGVPAAVPPRLEYEEGAPLVVSRAALRVGQAEAAEAILILPAGALLAVA